MAFIEPKTGTLAKIKVVGIGGGGQNSVSSMVEESRIHGVEFIVMNTDLQALNSSSAEIRLQLGPERTHGLGSGADPDVGLEAAQESTEDIRTQLQGADMVFIAAGLGGGTGTGGAPIVAEIAKQAGALTVGVVTKPFGFEGKRRMNQAEQGIRELKGKVDALIVIPNEKLLEIVEETMPLKDAFKIADEVVGKAVEGISDLITSTGLVNVDFADVKAIMRNAGSALMGIGESDGENRAEKAAKAAINSPLLDVDINGSTGILINIVGDSSLSMHEVNTAAKIVSDAAHEGANIIFGANVDPAVEGIRVTVIATGFDSNHSALGLVDVPSISGEEVIEQIDARFDRVVSVDDNNEVQPEHAGDSSDEGFDIDRLREEVEKMEEEKKKKGKKKGKQKKGEEPSENDKKKDDPREEPSSFWKSFLRDRR